MLKFNSRQIRKLDITRRERVLQALIEKCIFLYSDKFPNRKADEWRGITRDLLGKSLKYGLQLDREIWLFTDLSIRFPEFPCSHPKMVDALSNDRLTGWMKFGQLCAWEREQERIQPGADVLWWQQDVE